MARLEVRSVDIPPRAFRSLDRAGYGGTAVTTILLAPRRRRFTISPCAIEPHVMGL